MAGFGFGYGSAAGRRATVAKPEPVVGELEADGFSFAASAGEPSPGTTLPALRSGFSDNGEPVLHDALVTFGTPKRQPYPNQGVLEPGKWCLTQSLYFSDEIVASTNSSAREAPQPIAAWAMPGRKVVSTTLAWELVAFHKDAKDGAQVACVKVRATDGANATDWQTVRTTSLSTLYPDINPVEAYAGVVDVSALNDGLIWLEAEVYPWFGTQDAVLRSENVTSARGFSRRVFLKNAALFAEPPLAYVASSGSDSSGVVSTDAAVAAAAPFQTLAGALVGLHSSLGSSRGALDGARIRILDSIRSGSIPYIGGPLHQDIAAVVVERAPDTQREDAVVQLSASLKLGFTDHSAGIAEGALHFSDCTVTANSALAQLSGKATSELDVTFENCLVACGQSANLRNYSHISVYGGEWSQHTLSVSANGEVRCLRGVDFSGDYTSGSPEAWVILGCEFSKSGPFAFKDSSENGHVIANNRFWQITGTSVVHFRGAQAGAALGSIAIAQNLFERTSGTGVSIRLSADSDLGDLTHVVCCHNTVTGEAGLNRLNLAYDDHPDFPRRHGNLAFSGNLVPQVNTKGDIFMSDPDRTGHIEFDHGVDCAGNYAISASNGLGSQNQFYPGPHSVLAGGKPGFVDDKSVTMAGPGAGYGNYHLAADSPARSLMPGPVLGYDLDGNPRQAGSQPAGCYM